MTASPGKKRIFSSERVRNSSGGMRRLIRNILLIVNFVFVGALLLAYLSVYINPSVTAIPALFGLAYPYLVLANFIMAVIWALKRKWYAFISLGAILLGAGNIHNFIRFRNHGVEVHHDLKLVSYNVRLFNFYEAGEKNSYRRMVQLLKKEDPGIFCIQEYFVKGSPASGEQKLKEGLGGRLFSHFKLIRSGKDSYYGIVTLSRYNIINRGDIVHPKSSSLTIFSDIVVGSDTFRIYNNHLQSFRLRRMERSLLSELTVEGESNSVGQIMNIGRSLVRGFAHRASQVERVRKHIETSPYPVIIVGDFNDTPVSYTYRKMRKGFHDAFVEAGYGAGFTYRGKYPANRIDYVLYTDELKCTDFDIVKVKYSDHYPIITYFRRAD